jgi:hypothetical protein
MGSEGIGAQSLYDVLMQPWKRAVATIVCVVGGPNMIFFCPITNLIFPYLCFFGSLSKLSL